MRILKDFGVVDDPGRRLLLVAHPKLKILPTGDRIDLSDGQHRVVMASQIHRLRPPEALPDEALFELVAEVDTVEH